MKRGFVFCACGNDSAARANVALKFLKRFTKLDIVVIKARSYVPIYHDQVLESRVPDRFTAAAAAISLKTTLHRILPSASAEWCYLDTNVVAVDRDVDRVFKNRRGPVAFACDDAEIDSLSPNVTGCACSGGCRHLRQGIRTIFSVPIRSGDWRAWNPSVFVFGPESAEILDLWNQNAARLLGELNGQPNWARSEQWTLAAAVWKLRLQDTPHLPKRFHRIVDPFRGVERDKREYLHASQLPVDKSYSLDARGSRKPVFLQFAGNTMGKTGWKNWDDVSALISPSNESTANRNGSAAIGRRRGHLTPIHGMWIGAALSRMELLTLRSFVRQGHRFHLWVYDQLRTPVPEGVVLEDATEILPREAVFAHQKADPRNGVGAGSYSAPFSDLFRYKLLHEKGGYWSDMDVTCLKPFPSDTPYLFRSHQIGVAGSIMKCPRGCALMAETYQEALRLADANSEWLLPNRILTNNIKRLGLSKYIRDDFCSPDSWNDVVRPFAENDFAPPPQWFAIHWINEVWRTLGQNGGRLNGRQAVKYRMDKDRPKQGTTLARLYEMHGLDVGWRHGHTASSKGNGATNSRANSNCATSLARVRLSARDHINVLVSSLAIGGAERIVTETLRRLGLARPGWSATLFVMNNVEPSYSGEIPGVETVRLGGGSLAVSCSQIANRVLRSGTPTLFTHLGDESLLRMLWASGVRTIPVVHNSPPGWQSPATLYNSPSVPFVVAICDSVAQELAEHGCLKQTVVVRHEIVAPAGGKDRARLRSEVRARHGIPDDALLVGMVGQFKRQKNYPKAVRVLAVLQKTTNAKLMILGPWDHSWGDGRQVFGETYAAACELDVVADLITPGAVANPEDYYPAFDILLSTSSYEGLSISMLEARALSCPVVASDVGGAAEIESELITLLPCDAAPEEYADSVLRSARSAPCSALTAEDPELIPELWSLLGQFGDPDTYPSDKCHAACVVDTLNASSAQANILRRLSAEGRIQYVLCLGPVDPDCEKVIRSHGVRIYDVRPVSSAASTAGALMRAIQEIGISAIFVVGIDCRLRLLLAKVLPPEAVAMYDSDPQDSLFRSIEQERTFQRRIAFDESAYFRRISPWPGSVSSPSLV